MWRVYSKPHLWQKTSKLEYSFPIFKLRCRISSDRYGRKDVPNERRRLGRAGRCQKESRATRNALWLSTAADLGNKLLQKLSFASPRRAEK